MATREREQIGAGEEREQLFTIDRSEQSHAVPEDSGNLTVFVVGLPPWRAGEHETMRDRVTETRANAFSSTRTFFLGWNVPAQNTYGRLPRLYARRAVSICAGVARARSTPLCTTRIRSREIGVWVAISFALNSETAMTRRARFAAAANPCRWNLTPRRVNASGITMGAASCTVTTRGTFPVGGTAGDGACTRSIGASRRTGPAAPRTCQAS